MREARPYQLMILALAVPLLFVGCGKKDEGGKSGKGGKGGDQVFAVSELGVQVTAPADWKVKAHGNRWAVRGGMKGVLLGKARPPLPKSPEEAAARFADSKILEKATLPSGAFYVHYQMKFPTGKGKPPMWLKFVYVILPTKAGGATCQVQLQSDDEKALYERICKSLAPTPGSRNAAP